MTRLFNDPADFADEAADGFAAANARWVRRVTGGVVRVAAEPGKVAVAIGGGSGHYPPSPDWSGRALPRERRWATCSPRRPPSRSNRSPVRPTRVGGVLFSYGNYAGDVLNFDAAEAALNEAGIHVRTVTATDDISSAGADEVQKRRGIAGALFVFKCARRPPTGATRWNVWPSLRPGPTRTRARSASRSPAAPCPALASRCSRCRRGACRWGWASTASPDSEERDVPTADGLAELLVESVLAERPADGVRAVAILNGLGSVKYEELFVLYGNIARRLGDAGVDVVEPEGRRNGHEFRHGRDLLTLAWLDDELEALWAAPARLLRTRRARSRPSSSRTARPSQSSSRFGSHSKRSPSAVRSRRRWPLRSSWRWMRWPPCLRPTRTTWVASTRSHGVAQNVPRRRYRRLKIKRMNVRSVTGGQFGRQCVATAGTCKVL